MTDNKDKQINLKKIYNFDVIDFDKYEYITVGLILNSESLDIRYTYALIYFKVGCINLSSKNGCDLLKKDEIRPSYVVFTPSFKSQDGEFRQYFTNWIVVETLSELDITNDIYTQLVEWMEDAEADIEYVYCGPYLNCDSSSSNNEQRKYCSRKERIRNYIEESIIPMNILSILIYATFNIRCEKIDNIYKYPFDENFVNNLIGHNIFHIDKYLITSCRKSGDLFFGHNRFTENDSKAIFYGQKIIPMNMNELLNNEEGKKYYAPYVEVNNIIKLSNLVNHDICNGFARYKGQFLIEGVNVDLFNNYPIKMRYELLPCNIPMSCVALNIIMELVGNSFQFCLDNHNLLPELHKIDIYQFPYMLMVLIYNLTVFHEHMKMVHGDLHMGNITLDYNRFYKYMKVKYAAWKFDDVFLQYNLTDFNLYQPITKNMIYIIDFSRSISLTEISNKLVSYSSELSLKDDLNKIAWVAQVRDFRELLTNMKNAFKNTKYTYADNTIIPFYDLLPDKSKEILDRLLNKLPEIRDHLDCNYNDGNNNKNIKCSSPGRLLLREFKEFMNKPESAIIPITYDIDKKLPKELRDRK